MLQTEPKEATEMSRLIVSEFVSLNGIMEAPGGEPTHPHSGWTFKSIYGDDHYEYKDEELREADSLLPPSGPRRSPSRR